jgi:hypothetical protein
VSRIKGTRSSAALIVAVVALVAALGGGAVAGVTISKLNKKEKKQVKRIAKKLDGRAIKSIPAGPRGPEGPKGDSGFSGLEKVQATSGSLTTSDSSSPKLVSAICPAGKRAVTGSYSIDGGYTGSRPNIYGNPVARYFNVEADRVTVEASETGSGTSAGWRVRVWAQCADAE